MICAAELMLPLHCAELNELCDWLRQITRASDVTWFVQTSIPSEYFNVVCVFMNECLFSIAVIKFDWLKDFVTEA